MTPSTPPPQADTTTTSLPFHASRPTVDTSSSQPQPQHQPSSSADNDLITSLMTPATPTSHSDRARAALERAKPECPEWKPPIYTRRQSWDAQERRHEEHLAGLALEGVRNGPGFSERKGRAGV